MNRPWSSSPSGGGPPPPSTGFFDLKIGAGGSITGVDIANDGTLVCCADVFGAYVYNKTAPNPGNAGGTGVWQQLMTTSSMPSPWVISATQGLWGYGEGAWDIRIAPSNSSIIYMYSRDQILRSTDGGAHFIVIGSSGTRVDPNGGQQRNYKYKMAVDPHNPAVVVYTCNGSVVGFISTNATSGSPTWTSLASLGVAACDGNGVYCVAFDPSVTSGGSSQKIYISVSGTGVYKSTNGGGSFSAMNTNPTNPWQVTQVACGADGFVYAADGQNTNLLYINNGSNNTWTSQNTGIGAISVAVDPFLNSGVTTHLLVTAGGGSQALIESFDQGSTWHNATSQTSFNKIATDIPWLATLATTAPYPAILCPVFDPTVQNKVWLSFSQGIFTTTANPLSGGTQTFTSVSSGIEEIIGNTICWPPNGKPILSGWDVCLVQASNTTPTPTQNYPTTQAWPLSQFLSINYGVDWAKDNTLKLMCDAANNAGASVTLPALSTNGGANWSLITVPSGTNPGGCVAGSTSGNWLWCSSNGGSIYYSHNDGTNWTLASGIPQGTAGWGGSFYGRRISIAADYVTPTCFYAHYNNGSTIPPNTPPANTGLYVSMDGGVTWAFTHDIYIDPGGAASKLAAVPGNAGHLFLSSGTFDSGGTGASGLPNNLGCFSFTNNAQAGAGSVIWTPLTIRGQNFPEVIAFDLGAPAPGQSYPAIYVYGFYPDAGGPFTNLGFACSLGFLRCKNFNPLSPNSGTWDVIGNTFPALGNVYPGNAGWVDTATGIAADKVNYGYFAVAMFNTSAIYGYIP